MDATKELEKQIADLNNVKRLIENTLNLIADVEIKGAYASPVSEIQNWLTSFKSQVSAQAQGLSAALPKPEAVLEVMGTPTGL